MEKGWQSKAHFMSVAVLLKGRRLALCLNTFVFGSRVSDF